MSSFTLMYALQSHKMQSMVHVDTWLTGKLSTPVVGIGNFLQEFSRRVLYWEFGKWSIPNKGWVYSKALLKVLHLVPIQDMSTRICTGFRFLCAQHLGIVRSYVARFNAAKSTESHSSQLAELEGRSHISHVGWSYRRFQARLPLQSLKILQCHLD